MRMRMSFGPAEDGPRVAEIPAPWNGALWEQIEGAVGWAKAAEALRSCDDVASAFAHAARLRRLTA